VWLHVLGVQGLQAATGYNQEYNGLSAMGLVEFTEERPKLVHQAFREAAVPERWRLSRSGERGGGAPGRMSPTTGDTEAWSRYR